MSTHDGLLRRLALPMFYLMIVAILLTYFFPGLVTWLPEQMMSK